MASTPVLVVDASIAVKWYLLDEDSPEAALSLRGAFVAGHLAIAMPDIARYEVANALCVGLRRRRIGQEDARQAMADFLSWDFTYVGSNAIILAAVDVAHRFGCALYDALYLALAEALNVDFVTADRMLFESVHQKAGRVKWLGDYTAL